jgi:hypothetical protein
VPVPAQDLHWPKRTSQYRPKKGHDEYISVPVLDHLVSISAGLVPGPALCLVPVPLIDRKKHCILIKAIKKFN